MELEFSPIERTDYFEKLCTEDSLRTAFKDVKRNKGAAGIDEITVEDFDARLAEEITTLAKELREWRYLPKPVRRVEIPKPTGGVRMLGIPAVRDRVVQAALKSLLEPIFEPTFSESSYGFRPGRNQEMAVKAAKEIVQSGKGVVVDIDLAQFFDRIQHDRLIFRIKYHMKDTRVLRLIGLTLRSGIMKDGLVSPSNEGAPQGGPLSPLLSNIVLDELDKELERRGLPFCRFADDCNIFCGTEKSASRVMTNVTKFIEKKLKLVVNQEKSKVAKSHFVKFLGMTIIAGSIAISLASHSKAIAKTRELVRRGSHKTLEATVKEINQWYVGWSNYYKMTEYPSQLKAVEAHLRRRLRSRIIADQKKRRNLYARLIERGVKRRRAKVVFSNRGRWHLSHAPVMERAYPNKWFKEMLGLKTRSDENLAHWYDLSKWVNLREEPYT